jgi:Mn2+/Fe2+ NRAMP family transporter
MSFGSIGLYAAVLGMFFAFAGAAIETALSGAYNIAQFVGWPWGKYQQPRHAPRFTLTWIVIFVVCTVIIVSGVAPVKIVEYSIIFSVVVLPFTYLPVLVVASDKRIMGQYANGIVANVLGWVFLVLITLAAVAAIPLFVLTHGGQT